MALVPLRTLLDHAAENNYGVAAFNVNNMQAHTIKVTKAFAHFLKCFSVDHLSQSLRHFKPWDIHYNPPALGDAALAKTERKISFKETLNLFSKS